MLAFLLPLIYALGLAMFAAHELDAVARHEWRLIPGFSQLNDQLGQNIFILLHVPILWVVFWLSAHRSEFIRHRTQLSIDVFLVVHTIIHFGFSGHKFYEFSGTLSHFFIIGGGILGAMHAGLLNLYPTLKKG